MQTQYDAAILQQFADDLYARARWIVFTTALVYIVVAFIGSGILAGFLTSSMHAPDAFAMGMVIGLTLLFGAVGYNSGKTKAFQLKLQAQQTLCQRQIEINLRPTTKVNAAHV